MIRKFSYGVIIGLIGISLLAGCSKKAKVPASMSAVPADADIVGTLDAKAVVAYAKDALPKLLPAEMKDKVPSIQQMTEQLLKMAGVDLNKLDKITFIGYAGSKDKMAFIADGIDVSGLKGKKTGDYNGTALYAIPNAIHYAELKGKGIAGAPSEEMLKKLIDVNSGKAKSLASGERAKILNELAGVETDLNQLRVYVLTGKFPGMPPAPMTMNGGGFFVHLDKGLAGTVVSDKDGAADLKNKLDMGLMGVKMAMSMPEGGSGLPVKLDKDTKGMITKFLDNVKTSQSGASVSVSYHGDLKPLIEKAVAMGVKQFAAEESSSEKAVPVPPAPGKAAPPAPPAPAKAPAAPAKPAPAKVKK